MNDRGDPGLVRGEEAAAPFEYAVMLGLVIAVAVVVIGQIGGGLQDRWRENASRIVEAIGGSGGGP